MGRGWPRKAWTPRNEGISEGKSAFPGYSHPPLPALGLATIDEPHSAGQEGEAGNWASGSD